MSLYFPDLLRSVDVVAEQQRLQTVKFAPASDSEPARERAEGLGTKKDNAANAGSDLEAELSAAERMIAERDAAGAAQACERILLKIPGRPRAAHGWPVASVLRGSPAHAQALC